MTRRNTALLLGTLISPLACAEPEADPGAHYFSDFPVVLSASRLLQPAQEAPAAVTVIDRDMIRASGARQVAELFRLVPGFLVSYRNGHSPIVTYHGLSEAYPRRLQVMIDGVSVYSPLFGGVEWAELPITVDDIERIEVVRGPNGASFGANAVVGMINIITREPALGDTADVVVNSGGNGIDDWSARYAGQLGKLVYRLSAGQRSDHGIGRLSDEEIQKHGVTSFPDSSRVKHFNFRGNYRLDNRNEFATTLFHSDGVRTEYSSDIERPRRFDANAIQFRWTRATDDSEFWLQVHHSERRAREKFVLMYDLQDFGLPAAFPYHINFGNDARRDEIEFQHSIMADERWRLAWGGQWRRDIVDSDAGFVGIGGARSHLERLFLSSEWRPAKSLLVHAGATHEHSSISGSSTSPRVSLSLFLSERHTVRVGISRSQRVPTLYEEYVDQYYLISPETRAYLTNILPFLPPADQLVVQSVLARQILVQTYHSSGGLKNERILSKEVAYMGNWPSLRLSAEVRWFDDHLSDLIHPYPVAFPAAVDPTTRDFRNRDSATVRGVEGSLRWSPWRGADVMLAAARTQIDSTNIDADYEASAPTHTTSFLFSQRLPWDTAFSLAYYRVGEMEWMGEGDPLPAYDRVDLRLSKRFRFGRHAAELSWITQNVFNQHYPDFNDWLLSRRVSWLRFQYSF